MYFQLINEKLKFIHRSLKWDNSEIRYNTQNWDLNLINETNFWYCTGSLISQWSFLLHFTVLRTDNFKEIKISIVWEKKDHFKILNWDRDERLFLTSRIYKVWENGQNLILILIWAQLCLGEIGWTKNRSYFELSFLWDVSCHLRWFVCL